MTSHGVEAGRPMLRAEGLWGAGWAGACRCQYTTDPYLNAYVTDVMFFNHALRSAHNPARLSGLTRRLPLWRRETELSPDSEPMPESLWR